MDLDPKSKLQQKVLALKLGFTASDIKYDDIGVKHRWRATVHISHLLFQATAIFNSKRQAQTAAAQKVLDCWIEVAKRLKQSAKKHPPHLQQQRKRDTENFHWGYDSQEEQEEKWDSDEDDTGPTQEDYIRVGKLMYEIYRIFQRDA